MRQGSASSIGGGDQARPAIALLMPTYSDGGAERVMVDLANGFAKRGYLVDLVVVNESGPVRYQFDDSVAVISLDRPRVAVALPALLSYLRIRRPRSLLSTLEHTNILAVVAARMAGKTRVVLREANTPIEVLGRIGILGRVIGILMRLTYKSADGVVAVSEGVRESLIAALRLDPLRVRVIANPVITERLLEGARRPADHPWFNDGRGPVLLAVGRLAEQKGFDVLIRAFARSREAIPSRLVIFGEGPMRSQLQSLVDSLGVREYVSLPGFTDNPFSHMAACDLFVLSSRWEGLPNVLIQALACGARVVATDCPSGPKEVLDDGAIGQLVPVGDAELLANAISRGLVSDKPTLTQAWFDRYDFEGILNSYAAALTLAPPPDVRRQVESR